MFGTFEKFNLVRASYLRAGSSFYVCEDFHKPGQLRLGNNKSGDMSIMGDSIFDLKLTVNGEPVAYTYFADVGSLQLTAVNSCATAEIAFTDREHVRIRGENAGIRLELRSTMPGGNARACRGMYALLDGSGWEADITKMKLFFKSLSGSFYAVGNCAEDGAYTSACFDFLPDSSTGTFEAAVHYYTTKLQPFGGYEDFDALVDTNCADFAKFASIYRPAARGYEDVARYAAWTVWSHRTGTTEQLIEPAILFQSSNAVVAASWQQSYNAMPMLQDPKEAWRQICTLFNYQDERTGRLPGMISFTNTYTATGFQPPFQGFALDFIVRQIGEDFLTPEECERMYPKFAKWAGFWTTYRNAGRGDDVTAIKSPHESGWDDSSLFKDGFPCNDPCSLAFLVLLFESVARLARGCGKAAEADDWQKRADKLVKTLVEEFWDGEKFTAIVKGKPVDSYSLANFQPIMLGKRLPQHIIDKVAEKLTTEGELLTGIGLASESMTSSLVTFGVSFVCGRVVGPQNMILTVGLQAAGKHKEADMIARRFCDHVRRAGVILGYGPYDYFPLTGEKATEVPAPTMMDGWPWSSWTANGVLTMLGNIITNR